jgi:hypothetical protein
MSTIITPRLITTEVRSFSKLVARECELIRKRVREGLNAEEQAEIRAIQAEASRPSFHDLPLGRNYND